MIARKLFTRLTTHPELAALIGLRAYPMLLPQKPTLPALTYRKISDTGLAQTAAVHRDRYQISMFDRTYEGVQSVAAAAQLALENWVETNVRSTYKINHIDLYDSDTDVYIVLADYSMIISD